MGKTQKPKKSRTRRHNPLGQQPKQEPAPDKSSDGVQPIIDKLASSESQDRLWACATVSNIIHDDPPSRFLLLSSNIVGALIARLSDTASDVVAEAAGSLRNLCIDGGDDVLREMFNKKILPPLIACIPQISQATTEFLERRNARPKESQLSVCDFAENVITLMTCLAETSHKVLRAFNNFSTTVVPFLMLILKGHNQLPLRIAISAAECLYILSDENASIISSLKCNQPYLKVIKHLVQLEQPKGKPRQEKEVMNAEILSTELHSARLGSLKMLSCGIMQNLNLMNDASSGYSELVSALEVSVTEISSRALKLLVSKDGWLSDTPAHQCAVTAPINESSEFDCLEQKLLNLQLCLEILTGLSAIFPSTSFNILSDHKASKHDNQMDVDDESAHQPDIVGASSTTMNQSLRSISKVLAKLTEPLMKLVIPTEMSFQSNTATSFHPSLTPLLSNIHIAALNCLGNLFISLDGFISLEESSSTLSPADMLSAVSLWSRLWAMFLSFVDNHKQWDCLADAHLRMYEAALGSLWGVARICKGHLLPDITDVNRIAGLCSSAIDDGIQVKCIGLLECIAHTPFNIDINDTVSRLLFSFVRSPQHSHPEPALQAAAGIIDIISDESRAYDVNFIRNGWLAALEGCQGTMQQLVEALDNPSSLRSHGDEVMENLVAFIDYRKHLAN